MSAYQIQTCSWTDMDDLQSLSANALRNSPLTNALLTNPPGSGRSNTVHTRHTLAHHIYLLALLAQDCPRPTSKVIKAVNTRHPPPETQACAWLQWYPRSASASASDDDVEAAHDIPDCIDGDTWMYIENIQTATRKRLMEGEVLKTLDFPPNISGWNAAREILSRIQRMDTSRAVVAIAKIEHGVLFRELGWWDGGGVGFEAVRGLGGGGGMRGGFL